MIPVFSPNVGADELRAIGEVFDSSWLGRGKREADFKSLLANYFGVGTEQLCLSGSCTELIFAFVRLFVPKDKVTLIPTISFPAIGSALLEFDVPYRLVDVDESGCISINELEKLSQSVDVGAVFLTHYGSAVVETDQIRAVLGEDVLVLEDSACALGAFTAGKAVGTSADFACWSFDAMKLITTGDGGLGFCKNPEHAKILREYLYLGLSEQEKSGLDKSKSGIGWWEYTIEQPGRRAIMNDISAAMGISQLEKIDGFLRVRRENTEFFFENLEGIGDLKLISKPNNFGSCYYFTIATKQRDKLAPFLKENGIYTTFRYWPLHKMDIFEGRFEYAMADNMSDTYLNLPCHAGIGDDDRSKIVDCVRQFFK